MSLRELDIFLVNPTISWKEVFKQEVNKMLHVGILKPVEKATPWINSFVLVEVKNPDGSIKLRICLDPTNLNKAVICEPYCSKTPEDIAHLLANAKVITVTDCSKGFWHEELDEDSSYLTTFNTEFGCFRFTRMPFGVNVAGDVFQQNWMRYLVSWHKWYVLLMILWLLDTKRTIVTMT